MKNLFVLIAIFTGAAWAADAQISAGGNYSIEKSVMANGGVSGTGASTNGIYTVEGTIGQNAAGTTQHNSTLKFQPGFWTAQVLAPTAAGAILGGRVTTVSGQGIKNARLTLTMPSGETRNLVSGSFGYYRFEDLAAGGTYILTVTAKRFVFSVPAQVVPLSEDRGDIDFIGDVILAQ